MEEDVIIYGKNLKDRTRKCKQGNAQNGGSLVHTRIMSVARGSEETAPSFWIIKDVTIQNYFQTCKIMLM